MTTTYEVHAVVAHGTVAVAYGVDRDGTEVAVAVEPRMAANLRHELDEGRRPRVMAEPWQVIMGYPRPHALR